MGQYTPSQIRNVAFLGHSGSGKSTLAEALLHAAKAIDRRGSVEEGTSFFEVEPEEISRQMSISLSFGRLRHRGAEITLVSTPGYLDFVAETRLSLELVEGAVLVVDAVSGVESGTESALAMLRETGTPFLVAVNKTDRDNADVGRVAADLRALLGPGVQLLTDPASGSLLLEAGAPEDMRGPLVEAAVEGDDALLGRYLEGEEISVEDLLQGLAASVRSGSAHPVLGVSGLTGTGASELLDAMVLLLPPPEDRGGPAALRVLKTMADPFVGRLSLFKVMAGEARSDAHLTNVRLRKEERLSQLYRIHGKQKEPVPILVTGEIGAVAKLSDTTTWDVLAAEAGTPPMDPVAFPAPQFRLAVAAHSEADEEKLSSGLSRLIEEDPSLTIERPADTNALLVAGYGEVHLEVLRERLKRKMGVSVDYSPPPVAYRETLRGTAKAEGKHKKQSGGHGQFGHVWLEVAPSQEDFVWVDKIFGGAVSVGYRPAVEKGVREAMAEGILAGFPLTGVKVTLYDGSEHPVDSSEMAFKIAGALAFRKAAQEASPVLLEPVMDITVTCPEELMGDVLGDLNKRRGRVLAMDASGERARLEAQVPQAELVRYAIDLRSLTGGRASFDQAFHGYQEVPGQIARQIIGERSHVTA